MERGFESHHARKVMTMNHSNSFLVLSATTWSRSEAQRLGRECVLEALYQEDTNIA